MRGPDLLLCASAAALTGCGTSPLPSGWSDRTASPTSSSPSSTSSPASLVASIVQTPQPELASAPETLHILRSCESIDAALTRTAIDISARSSDGSALPDSFEVSSLLREHGSAYVAPHLWQASSAPPFAADAFRDRFEQWLSSQSFYGRIRCGLARRDQNRSTLTIVVVDALADLDPTPMEQRAGAWVSVNGPIHVDAHSAKLVVAPPGKLPRNYPTTLHQGRAASRFNTDQPGRWTAQLLLTLPEGPLPVLELEVFADTEVQPSAPMYAPGEHLALGDDPHHQLAILIHAARSAAGSPPLLRVSELDSLASAHARAVAALGRTVHDAGDGDPYERLSLANIAHGGAGENVARGRTLLHAHRATWSSPSHRANLLDPHFNAMGVGVQQDDDGTWWVVELFAAL